MLELERSFSLFKEIERVIPGGVNTNVRALTPPIVFERADGAMIYDVDGREYIDYHCAFGPIILGHSFPAVVTRVVQVMSQIDLLTSSEYRLHSEPGRTTAARPGGA